jgi:hypothetical protein
MRAAATWPKRHRWLPGRLHQHTGTDPGDRAVLAPLAARLRRALTWGVATGLVTIFAAIVVADLEGIGSSATGGAWANGAFASHVVVNEIVRNGRASVAEDVVAADAVIETPDDFRRGPAGLIAFSQALHRSVADPRLMIESVSRDGERVAMRWTLTGTIRQPFLGLDPTTERAFVTGEFVSVIRDGVVQSFVVIVDEEWQPLVADAG